MQTDGNKIYLQRLKENDFTVEKTMEIRKSAPEDMDAIMSLIDGARAIMRSDGNMNQWTSGYPSRSMIERDMERGVSYMCINDGEPVATFAFIQSPEPTYAKIFGGHWLNDDAYYVVHRIAGKPDVHGIFSAIMDYCFSVTKNIRIDTHRDNRIMQHLLMRHGFTYCGIIYLLNGDERLAYQKEC